MLEYSQRKISSQNIDLISASNWLSGCPRGNESNCCNLKVMDAKLTDLNNVIVSISEETRLGYWDNGKRFYRARKSTEISFFLQYVYLDNSAIHRQTVGN